MIIQNFISDYLEFHKWLFSISQALFSNSCALITLPQKPKIVIHTEKTIRFLKWMYIIQTEKTTRFLKWMYIVRTKKDDKIP